MSEYPHNDRVRRFATAGNQSSFGMALYNNNYVHQRSPNVTPNVFLVPQFSSNTGTLEYYGQKKDSIFLIYARPFLVLNFTGNTDTFSADSRLMYMRNEIYKIDNNMSSSYLDDPNEANRNKILNRIRHPFISYTASTTIIASGGSPISSGFTYPFSGGGDRTSGFTFVLFPDQNAKGKKSFTEELFEDKSQYFFRNTFAFKNTATTFSETVFMDQNGNRVNYPYNNTTVISSTGPLSRIANGPFSGEMTGGLFFTCFQAPGKPALEFPRPHTAVTLNSTFTPIFNFSNVEDGDEYILEVTYNLKDTGFTDTISTTGITQYRRPRNENSKEQLVDKTDKSTVGVEITQTKTTRRINVPLKPNIGYLYRIGNSKSIINIFGIRNEIINYSGYFSGVTGGDTNINLIVDSKTVSVPSTGITANKQYKPNTPPYRPPFGPQI